MSAVADTGRTRLPATAWRLTAAFILVMSADTLVMFALLWLAAPQGWSGLQVALLVLALRCPSLLVGRVGGAALDRYGPRRAMVLCAVGAAALIGALGVTGWSGTLPLAAVLVLGGASGALTPLLHAGSRAYVPRLVPPASLGRANALLGIGDQLPLLLSAVLVGPLVSLFGPGPMLLGPAAMLLAGAALVRTLPERRVVPLAAAEPDPTHGPEPAARSPWSGRVVALVALSVAYYFSYGPFEPAMPAYTRDHLGGDATTYGLLWTVFGIGALATLPLAPRLAATRPGLVNAVGAALWGTVTLLLVVTDEPAVAIGIFAVSGAIWGPYTAVELTALHRWVPAERHGRVLATQRSLVATAAPLGAAVGAILLDPLGPVVLVALTTGACLLAGLAAASVRSVRTSR